MEDARNHTQEAMSGQALLHRLRSTSTPSKTRAQAATTPVKKKDAGGVSIATKKMKLRHWTLYATIALIVTTFKVAMARRLVSLGGASPVKSLTMGLLVTMSPLFPVLIYFICAVADNVRMKLGAMVIYLAESRLRLPARASHDGWTRTRRMRTTWTHGGGQINPSFMRWRGSSERPRDLVACSSAEVGRV